MSAPTRYNPDHRMILGLMRQDAGGEYVRFSDHEAAIAKAREDALREAADAISADLLSRQRNITRWKDAVLGKPSVKYRVARADVDARQSCRDKILAMIGDKP